MAAVALYILIHASEIGVEKIPIFEPEQQNLRLFENYYPWSQDENPEAFIVSDSDTFGDVLAIRTRIIENSGLGFYLDPGFFQSTQDALHLHAKSSRESLRIQLALQESGPTAEEWNYELGLSTEWSMITLPLTKFRINTYFHPGSEPGNQAIDVQSINKVQVNVAGYSNETVYIDALYLYRQQFSYAAAALIGLLFLWYLALTRISRAGEYLNLNANSFAYWCNLLAYAALACLLVPWSNYAVFREVAYLYPFVIWLCLSLGRSWLMNTVLQTPAWHTYFKYVHPWLIFAILKSVFPGSHLVQALFVVECFPLIANLTGKGIGAAVVYTALVCGIEWVYFPSPLMPAAVLVSPVLVMAAATAFSGYHYLDTQVTLSHLRWQQRLLERERDELTGYYHASINNMTDGYLLFKPDKSVANKLVCITANPAASNVLNIPQDELIQTPLMILFPPTVELDLNQLGFKALSEQRSINFQYYHDYLHSMKIILEGVVYPVGDVVAVQFWDSTANKQFEEQMRHAHKIEVINQLAQGVSHNLNNLLTGIIGNLSLAKMNTDQAKKAELLEKTYNATTRSIEVVQDLIKSCREPNMKFEACNLNELVFEVYTLMRKTTTESIVIHCDLDDALPLVHGDAKQLKHVLTTLCINATESVQEKMNGDDVDFGKNHSLSIRLSTQFLQHESQMLPPALSPSAVLIQVEDKGMGMSSEVREKIFEPFFSTKSTVGTGLNLASAYSIIQSHKGIIQCHSEPGKGSLFSIFLPARPSTPSCANGKLKEDGINPIETEAHS